MNNLLNKLQFNEVVSISSIIIIFEFIVLLFLLTKIISYKNCQDVLSPLIILNFFILFVMFLTDCKIDTTVKISVVSLKIILLLIVLYIVKFSWKNYLIGLLFLLIYFIFSDINEVYSCNVKMINLAICLVFSTLTYLLCSVTKNKIHNT